MGRLYTSPKQTLILPQDLVKEIVQQPFQSEEDVSEIGSVVAAGLLVPTEPIILEKIVEVVKQVDRIVYVDRPVETIVTEIKEKIVEVPVIEYVTITKIETVEVPVEVIKEVERIITIHDIDATIQEKKRVVALEQKVSRYQIAVAALIILTVILGAV